MHLVTLLHPVHIANIVQTHDISRRQKAFPSTVITLGSCTAAAVTLLTVGAAWPSAIIRTDVLHVACDTEPLLRALNESLGVNDGMKAAAEDTSASSARAENRAILPVLVFLFVFAGYNVRDGV